MLVMIRPVGAEPAIPGWARSPARGERAESRASDLDQSEAVVESGVGVGTGVTGTFGIGAGVVVARRGVDTTGGISSAGGGRTRTDAGRSTSYCGTSMGSTGTTVPRGVETMGGRTIRGVVVTSTEPGMTCGSPGAIVVDRGVETTAAGEVTIALRDVTTGGPTTRSERRVSRSEKRGRNDRRTLTPGAASGTEVVTAVGAPSTTTRLPGLRSTFFSSRRCFHLEQWLDDDTFLHEDVISPARRRRYGERKGCGQEVRPAG